MNLNNFLTALCGLERVYIRFLLPKGMPLEIAESLGMAFRDKDHKLIPLTVSGGLDLKSGIFTRTYSNGRSEHIADGLGYLQTLNQQGYGVYFVPHHGNGFKAENISHGTCLFHESDRLSVEAQQSTIARISAEFGEPTAVVRTRKSLHAYWASSETIPIEKLGNFQRRWLQYSECDDSSLADPAQLMRLPEFNHVHWNAETRELERVRCELVHLSEAIYSLVQFDKILPPLDLDRWVKSSLEVCHKDTTETDIRAFSEYLDGFKANGRKGWITAKCPAHNGDSEDSLHVEHDSGGFICHAGCSPSAVYQAAKSVAIARGYRLPTSDDSGVESEVRNIMAMGEVARPQLFGNEILDPIRYVADRLNLPHEAYISALLPTAASQLRTGTLLELNPATGFIVSPVMWVGIVGESGSKKSPILRAINHPLDNLQSESELEYQAKLEQHETELEDWSGKEKGQRGAKPKPPCPREHYLADFTMESLGATISNQPDRGLPIYIDELARFFHSMDAYRSGKGGDRQNWLSLYDGGPLKNNRKTTGRVYAPRTNINIVGGIQPSIIEKIMMSDESSDDGLWPRFSWVRIPLTISPGIVPGSQRSTLTETLAGLYKRLNTLEPKTYVLSPEAIEGWNDWHFEIERLTLEEPSGILRSAYPKLRERAARIALIVHAANSLTPSESISSQTLQDAIAYTRWLMGQTRLLYAELGISDSPETARILKFVQRFKGCGEISARQVCRWWSAKDELSAKDARAFMAKMVKLGYAKSNDSPSDSSNFKIIVLDNGGDSGDKSAQALIEKRVQLSPQYGDNGGDSGDNFINDSPNNQTPRVQPVTTVTTLSPYCGDTLNPIQNKALELVVTTVTTDLENKKNDWIEIDESISNSQVNESNQEKNGESYSEFSAITSQDLKRELLKIGDRVRLLAEIETSQMLPVGHKGVVQKITTGGYLVLFDGVSNPVTVFDSEIERCDDDQGDHSIDLEPKPINPRDALSIADGRIAVDLETLDLNHQPSVYIPQWQPKTALKPYEQLKKLYLDIETTGLDPVKDRIVMVGLMDENGQKTILTDSLEKATLKELIEFLRVHKPDLLIGHNLFGFDLPFIIERCKRKGITQPLRQGRKTQRITSASMNGKPIEFTSVYWTGVNIIDTMQQIAVWDKQASRLVSYGLKPSTIALGLRDERRLELSNDEIQQCWQSGDISTLGQYLNYDLEDTALLADFLLPVVYYQMAYVPGLSFQELAIASPALKAQKIHQALLPNLTPDADEPLKYEGGKVDLLAPGLHRNVAKIDVSSLYPSVMLRYGVCSKKDPDHRFLGVMAYMTQERLKLKEQAKQGDKAASFQEKSLKILINGSYGFLGTGGYTFNDFEAAALVTAYGRKILNLMMAVVSSCGATVIEVDTDGIFFSHDEPKAVYDLVQDALPEGINIELELENCGLYAPKAKSYVIVHPNGKTTVKGLFRKRDRYPLERVFPVEFLRLYFTESPEAAKVYYNSIRESILNRSIPVDQLTITRRIGSAEKTLVELGLGKAGDRVSFWYAEQQRVHSRSGKALPSVRIETQTAPYWIDYYLQQIDELYQAITGDNALRLAELPLFQSREDAA